LKILKTFFVKTKTLLFVLEAPRDQDFGLEDCITGNGVSKKTNLAPQPTGKSW